MAIFSNQDLNTGNSEFNALMFVINSVVGRLNVATLVRVVDVHTTGRTDPTGTVDVLPLVQMKDGSGATIENATVFGIPFLRIQGGTNAVICDPRVDDVGFCVFADRDISSVKSAMDSSPVMTYRRFNMSDGLYLGGWCAGSTPEHYVVVDDDGITIEAGSKPADVNASKLTINCDAKIVGDLEVTGDITTMLGEVQAKTIKLTKHIHYGVTVGFASTEVPTP